MWLLLVVKITGRLHPLVQMRLMGGWGGRRSGAGNLPHPRKCGSILGTFDSTRGSAARLLPCARTDLFKRLAPPRALLGFCCCCLGLMLCLGCVVLDLVLFESDVREGGGDVWCRSPGWDCSGHLWNLGWGGPLACTMPLCLSSTLTLLDRFDHSWSPC